MYLNHSPWFQAWILNIYKETSIEKHVLTHKTQMEKNPQNLEWNPRHQNSRITTEICGKEKRKVGIKVNEAYQGSIVEGMEDWSSKSPNPPKIKKWGLRCRTHNLF